MTSQEISLHRKHELLSGRKCMDKERETKTVFDLAHLLPHSLCNEYYLVHYLGTRLMGNLDTNYVPEIYKRDGHWLHKQVGLDGVTSCDTPFLS